jgi:uncharacterized protein YbbK (DUF523 family)
MYIVSSCLAGVNCRYDGRNTEIKEIVEMVKEGKAIPLCPELLAGLPTPRKCCELVENCGEQCVISSDGQDFTRNYLEGAEKTLAIARILGIDKAILKSKSPSCGFGRVYDGTFTGKLIEGNGLTAQLLVNNGIKVYSEQDLNEIV